MSNSNFKKEINLPLYSIQVVVYVNKKGVKTGYVTSKLNDCIDTKNNKRLRAYKDMRIIEKLICKHAINGVKINSVSYLNGIKESVNEIIKLYEI